MEANMGLTVGQVAERTGLSTHTLRFYEREGVMADPVRRRPNGHRVYSTSDVQWLAICTRLRASGMPLTEIRRFADLIRQGAGNEDERLALLRSHERRILAQIVELQDCLAVISRKVTVYEQHVSRGTATEVWTPADPEPAEPSPGRPLSPAA